MLTTAPDGPQVDAVRTVVVPGPTRLVRPDGYVARAAENPTPTEVAQAVTNWVGA